MFKVQSFQPHRLLQDYIVSYLVLESDFQETGFREMTVLPHVMQSLTFNIGTPQAVYDITHQEYPAASSITGPNHDVCELRIMSGFKQLVTNLKPGAWYKLFRISSQPFCNKSGDLSVVLGPQVAQMSTRLKAGVNEEQQVRILEAFLLQQLWKEKKYARNIDDAIRLIFAADGNISIRQLEAGVFMTKRTLERNFLEQTGLHLKMFCRVVRFRKTIEYIERERFPQWSLLAQKFGYSDQTHFINEFRYFTHCLPHEYPGFRSDLEQAMGL